MHSTDKTTSAAVYCAYLNLASSDLAMHPLTRAHEDETLAFLAHRPLHTFGLVGFIKSNGMVSPHNRGIFYACRDDAGQMLGVALIGRATVFEAGSEAVIEAFATAARNHPDICFLLAESEKASIFWDYYGGGRPASFSSHYNLLVKHRGRAAVKKSATGLRQATINDLDQVVTAHARSGVEENNINSLRGDMAGFVQRCARRIEMGQTWVLIKGGRLVFKADVLTYTPDVAYMEAVWVDPEERGRGYGSHCVSDLSETLLAHTRAVCLLVDSNNFAAHALYRKIGYAPSGAYQAVFV